MTAAKDSAAARRANAAAADPAPTAASRQLHDKAAAHATSGPQSDRHEAHTDSQIEHQPEHRTGATTGEVDATPATYRDADGPRPPAEPGPVQAPDRAESKRPPDQRQERPSRRIRGEGDLTGEYVVLLDNVGFLTYDDDDQQHNRASFLQHVVLGDSEARRLLALSAVAAPEDAQDVLNRRHAAPSDAELQAMNPEQLTAYLVQHAHDAARIYQLEVDREDGGREIVLDATGDLADHLDG